MISFLILSFLALLSAGTVTALSTWQSSPRLTGRRTCLPPYNANTTFVGCFTDETTPRTLNGTQLPDSNANTPESCATQCGLSGYSYSGVEYSTQCFCSHQYPILWSTSSGTQVDTSQCNTPCPGNASESCGGGNRIDVYKISNPSTSPYNPTLPNCAYDPLCSNDVCDSSLSVANRAAALVNALTLQEKINNVQGTASGVARLGIPSFQWDSEALHGVANSAGAHFKTPLGLNFSSATSFPAPLSIAASFDDALTGQIASAISTEARAFVNGGQAGLAYMTPNINGFRDPRWGRGMETPGEAVLVIQNYAKNLIPGLQGGLNPEYKRIIATCKHYAAYDIEDGRNGNDLNPTQQDLADYYSQGFKTCIRDAKAGAVMCSYNAVNGIPSCANRYLLQNVVREHWDFSDPYNLVIGDCGAVMNVYDPHKYVSGMAQAAAVSLNAGTDIDCGPVAYNFLNESIPANLTTESALNQAATRAYAALIQAGYFDNPAEYKSLSWADVNTVASQQLAYKSAIEGITLLKNDGILPLPKTLSKVAIIGPMANATSQMQGDYYGTPPYFVTPLEAFQKGASEVQYELGTLTNTTSTTNFSAAITAAKDSDYIIYVGGIDNSIEYEGHDRPTINWPGNQLDLIEQLAALGKKLIIVQWGAGQIDDSTLLNNTSVNGIIWVGYSGQDGGQAIYDILTGVQAPAGRLPVTQYPADYVNQVSIFDMNLRPSSGNPGRTYAWYTGHPVLPFGYGLHYTNFSVSWKVKPKNTYDIQSLVAVKADPSSHTAPSQGLLDWPSYRSFKGPYLDLLPFVTVSINVQNTGKVVSDYVGLVFISTKNGGPSPYPNKELASYGRLHGIEPGSTQTLNFSLTLDNIARTDVNGDRWVYPGDYSLALDYDSTISVSFKLSGKAQLIDSFPRLLSNITSYEYVGCFTTPQPTLSTTAPNDGKSNDPQVCVNTCAELGHKYSGVRQNQCLCGDSFDASTVPVQDEQCNSACPGNPYEFCGASQYINVFNASVPTVLEPATT
ncbi:glycoside hydrolase superfamily [Talaromyces proteolyticus]|uniref:xylan 1,4-beta-xylosidase n=1 Tax=Talaromyces proteolyticus TaxID=1131652 RepID=A0AAD4L340_9EURO|nr:glycoside hydrolase superfamily [Talaromyces proteolyticus]KAH8705720.1 glycoside hydrolase superfamily [Talaromyces proteolyticus]